MKKILVFAAFVWGLALVCLAQEEGKTRRFNPAIQRNLTIIENLHDYDLNPQTANYASEAQLFTGLYEGLFSYDPYSLDPVPALAESHRVSRDKKTWTFTLRNDAFFSNGDKITAPIIRDAWLSLLAPETNAPFASLLDCIVGAGAFRAGRGGPEDVGIAARDDSTLVVSLNTPTEHLNRILCHHAFAAMIPSQTGRAFSGPYMLKEHTPDRIVLEKNPRYHGADDVAIPSITLTFSEDMEDNAYQFNVGNADWAAAAETGRLLDQKSVKIFAEFATEYFFFKSDRFPWNNAEFRLALLTAVPWDQLRADAYVPAKTLIQSLYGYKSPEGISDYDLVEAQKLLAQAKKNAGMGEDEPVKIIIASSTGEYLKAKVDALKENWEQIGITVEIQTTPSSRYLQSIETWKADLFTYTWIGDFADPTAFLELFRGDSSLNVTAWKNGDFDLLLQKASECADSAERFSLLAQAEEVLLSSGAVLPVSHPVSVNIIDTNRLGGWYANALDIHPYKYLYFTGKTSAIPNIVRSFGD